MSFLHLSAFFFVIAIVGFSSVAFGQEHNHTSEFNFEYFAATDVPHNRSLSWNVEKINGAYSEGFPSMVAFFVPLTASQIGASSLLQANEQTVVSLLQSIKTPLVESIHETDGSHCINVNTCGPIVVPHPTNCYRLLFNLDAPFSHFQIQSPVVVGATDPVVALGVFAEHVPTEFSSAIPFLTDSNGVAQSFLFEQFSHGHNHDDHPQANRGVNTQIVGQKLQSLKTTRK